MLFTSKTNQNIQEPWKLHLSHPDIISFITDQVKYFIQFGFHPQNDNIVFCPVALSGIVKYLFELGSQIPDNHLIHTISANCKSYRNETRSKHTHYQIQTCDLEQIANRHVFIIEFIVDSGQTVIDLINFDTIGLKHYHPSSINLFTLFSKLTEKQIRALVKKKCQYDINFISPFRYVESNIFLGGFGADPFRYYDDVWQKTKI